MEVEVKKMSGTSFAIHQWSAGATFPVPVSAANCKKNFSTILPCPPPVSSVSSHSVLLQSFQSGRDTAGVRSAREKMEKRRAAARGVPDWDYSELHARE